MAQIKLRAHHGMCLQYFKGKGYSDDFTLHMQKVLEKMRDNPEIEIITHNDIICSHCPNLKDGLCLSPDKVYEYDQKVLKFCNLPNKAVMTWNEFSALVKQEILCSGKRKEICISCRWADICEEIEKSADLL